MYGWTSPCSYYNSKRPSAVIIKKLGKRRSLLPRSPGDYVAPSEVTSTKRWGQGERRRDKSQAKGLLLLGLRAGGWGIPRAQSSLVNFECSCLENPRDGGAWWAAVSGVTQNRTRLKWLSSSRAGTYSGKRKNCPIGQSWKPTKISKIKGLLWGDRQWLDLHLVLWRVKCLLKSTIFELDVSAKPKSDASLQTRENPTSGAHTIKTHTWILITVLSIVTSKLLWYIHEMECYSRIKMNELLTHATTWVNLRKKKKKTSKGSQTWETVFVGLHLSAWQPTPVLLPGESCG